MANADGRGYYRTAYTPAQLTALRDEAWPRLSPTERRALYFDAAEAALTGALPLDLALSLVPRLLAGGDRFAVAAALALPASLEPFVPDDLRPRYERYLRATFGPAAARIGLAPGPADSLDVERMRGGLIHAVAWLGRDRALVDRAVRLAARWRDLPQAIRGLVLAIAADARPALFADLRRGVAAEPDRARRREMYAALASVRDPDRLATALPLVLDPALDIREAHALLWGGATGAARAAARAFWRSHADAILARVPHAETRNPIAGASALFTQACKADERDAIADYVTRTFAGLPGGARTVRQNIEAMDQCIARKRLLEPAVRAWLAGAR